MNIFIVYSFTSFYMTMIQVYHFDSYSQRFDSFLYVFHRVQPFKSIKNYIISIFIKILTIYIKFMTNNLYVMINMNVN